MQAGDPQTQRVKADRPAWSGLVLRSL